MQVTGFTHAMPSWVFAKPLLSGARGVLVALALSVAAATAHAQHPTLVVTVGEADTHQFLDGAEVMLPELRRLARTNAMGEAVLPNVPRGDYRVRVRHLGHTPTEIVLRVGQQDTVGAVFLLERRVTTLQTVEVTAAANPWRVPDQVLARRQLGFGRFLVAEDLEREGDRDFFAVATSRIPGIRRTYDARNNREILATARGSCGGQPEPGAGTSCTFDLHCGIRVLLDDVDVTEHVSFYVKTWDLAAVEFYQPTAVPPQYRDGRAGCGVMLLWSKR